MRVGRASFLALLAVGVACEGSGGGSSGGGGGGGGGGNEVATLQLSTDGAGEIEVTGGAASHCRGNCTVTAAPGASVTLVAHPDAGQVFAGWGGACGGTGDCSLVLTGTASVSARFTAAPPPPPGRHALSVQHAGEGDGRVTSDPGGIDCGSACRADYDDGTAVTLTATAGADSRFDGWGGACSGSGACVVTLTADVVVTATFARTAPPPPATHTLAVQKTGDGGGKVTSDPGGIDCGSACGASFDAGTSVTLSATPDEGSTFGGWSGGACSGTGACVVKVDKDLTVAAAFAKAPPPPPAQHTLAVQKAGSGGGKVTSAPAGIDCGATCGATFASGTAVTLTAAPDAGSTFGGWGGACSGTSACVVKLDSDLTVTATFASVPPPPPGKHALAVQKTGDGGGKVTSAPAGIDCGSACGASFTDGTTVTLTATADQGSTFGGWSGGACSGTSTCVVKVDKDLTVTAAFAKTPPPPPAQHALAVQKSGDGGGKVTSVPAGIDCGATCSAKLDAGTSVTLTATPDAGSTFGGWSGACTGTGACVLKLDKDLTVTAAFAKTPPPPPAQHALAVQRTGDGGGTVTSAPAGIDCGKTCSAKLDAGTSVTLTPTPDASSLFGGWEGACTGTGPCVVKVDADATVTAAFEKRYGGFELTIPGGAVSPGGLDGGGDVAGTFQPDGGGFTRAFLYDASTKAVTWLSPDPAPAGPSFSAAAVNDARTVVVNDDVNGRVYRWSDGKLDEIDKPAAGKGTAINALGWVVGTMFPADGSARGFVNDGKETRTLVPLPGADFAVANAVNRDGVVVGVSGSKAVRYDGTSPVALPLDPVAMALDVSDAGLVVGSAEQQQKTIHAFVLDLGTGKVTIVPGLPQDFGVGFHAVNGSGTVVGSGARKDGSGRAVVWRDGKLEALEDLVAPLPFQLEDAVDVNDAGQILVWGRDGDRRSHTAILTPR